jgi:hypothetical protein
MVVKRKEINLNTMKNFKSTKKPARDPVLPIPLQVSFYPPRFSIQAGNLPSQSPDCPLTENGQNWNYYSHFGFSFLRPSQNDAKSRISYTAYDWLVRLGNTKPQSL